MPFTAIIRGWRPTSEIVMQAGLFSHILRRAFWALLLLVFVCMLPGPRSLIDSVSGYLTRPKSLDSILSGLHVSVTHFCWLFGLELQSIPYPDNVDPLVAAISLLFSVVVQVFVLIVAFFLWRYMFIVYDDDVADPEEE